MSRLWLVSAGDADTPDDYITAETAEDAAQQWHDCTDWTLQQQDESYTVTYDVVAVVVDDQGKPVLDEWGDALPDGDQHRIEFAIDAEEPECASDGDGGHHEHSWAAPIELVGGCEQNPGVFLRGGGAEGHEACLRCGTRRITSSGALDYTEGYYDIDTYALRDVDESTAWDVYVGAQSAEELCNLSVASSAEGIASDIAAEYVEGAPSCADLPEVAREVVADWLAVTIQAYLDDQRTALEQRVRDAEGTPTERAIDIAELAICGTVQADDMLLITREPTLHTCCSIVAAWEAAGLAPQDWGCDDWDDAEETIWA